MGKRERHGVVDGDTLAEVGARREGKGGADGRCTQTGSKPRRSRQERRETACDWRGKREGKGEKRSSKPKRRHERIPRPSKIQDIRNIHWKRLEVGPQSFKEKLDRRKSDELVSTHCIARQST